MKVTPESKRTIGGVIIVIAIIIAGFLGYNYPIPPMPTKVDGTTILPNKTFPLGYASSGEQVVLGTTAVNDIGTISHGLTTPNYALCSLSGKIIDNEEQKCSIDIVGSVVTVYVYKEDGTTGDNAVDVFWMVVGIP